MFLQRGSICMVLGIPVIIIWWRDWKLQCCFAGHLFLKWLLHWKSNVFFLFNSGPLYGLKKVSKSHNHRCWRFLLLMVRTWSKIILLRLTCWSRQTEPFSNEKVCVSSRKRNNRGVGWPSTYCMSNYFAILLARSLFLQRGNMSCNMNVLLSWKQQSDYSLQSCLPTLYLGSIRVHLSRSDHIVDCVPQALCYWRSMDMCAVILFLLVCWC